MVCHYQHVWTSFGPKSASVHKSTTSSSSAGKRGSLSPTKSCSTSVWDLRSSSHRKAWHYNSFPPTAAYRSDAAGSGLSRFLRKGKILQGKNDISIISLWELCPQRNRWIRANTTAAHHPIPQLFSLNLIVLHVCLFNPFLWSSQAKKKSLFVFSLRKPIYFVGTSS